MASGNRVEIPGSERELDPRHERLGEADGGKQIEVTLYLRSSGSLDWVDQEAHRPPAERRVLSREGFASSHGARPEDIEAVRAFAGEYGLEVSAVDHARRSVVLRGTVDVLGKAFGAQDLRLFRHPTAGVYRARRGALSIPLELGDVITGVFGIDERPQATPHLRRDSSPAAGQAYTPVQVAAAYSFPSGVTGTGQTAAIIELGGGYSETDLAKYFASLGLTAPTVSAVSVDAGTNSPGTDQNADGEVMLDIEVLGSGGSRRRHRRVLRPQHRPGLPGRCLDGRP